MKNPVCVVSKRPAVCAFHHFSRPRLNLQCTSPPRLAGQQRRSFRTGQSRPEETRSFRGQLYESTAQRLARERADESQFIENRQKMGPSKALQTFALTIRGSDFVFSNWPQELMRCSLLRRLRHRLLSGLYPSKSSSADVHHTIIRLTSSNTRCSRYRSSGRVGRFCEHSWQGECLLGQR